MGERIAITGGTPTMTAIARNGKARPDMINNETR